jgi:hypothetical protein
VWIQGVRFVKILFRRSPNVLLSADIEDGHTLHLVERPAGVPPSAATGQAHPHPQQQQNAQHHRINIGMIDMNGAIAASGVSLIRPPIFGHGIYVHLFQGGEQLCNATAAWGLPSAGSNASVWQKPGLWIRDSTQGSGYL